MLMRMRQMQVKVNQSLKKSENAKSKGSIWRPPNTTIGRRPSRGNTTRSSRPLGPLRITRRQKVVQLALAMAMVMFCVSAVNIGSAREPRARAALAPVQSSSVAQTVSVVRARASVDRGLFPRGWRGDWSFTKRRRGLGRVARESTRERRHGRNGERRRDRGNRRDAAGFRLSIG